MTLRELYLELDRHDWFYAMSDDPGVHEAGRRNWIKLFFEARKHDGGEQIFRDFSKHVFSGEAFGTPKHPKPKRPPEMFISKWKCRSCGTLASFEAPSSAADCLKIIADQLDSAGWDSLVDACDDPHRGLCPNCKPKPEQPKEQPAYVERGEP